MIRLIEDISASWKRSSFSHAQEKKSHLRKIMAEDEEQKLKL